MFALSLASLSLVIWLFLLLGRGGFWRVANLQASAGVEPLEPCRVVTIVPARNEADVIAQSLTSLRLQRFSGELHTIVVDDNSSDGTADVARGTGATVIDGLALTGGWTGKLWALQQGVVAGERFNPDFFLFTDADIWHDANNVSALVGIAQTRNLDLASHMVRLHCGTVAEKLTIPAFVFFFFMLYPPNWISSQRRKTAGAAGGCVLIRPDMLRRIGGLAAVRNELIDDCSLARAVKNRGGRLWLGLTPGTSSIRPYSGFLAIGRMISRSAYRQLDHSPLLLLGAVAGLAITYLVPALLGLAGNLVALMAWLLMTLCYLPMVRFYGLSPLWALTLPATAFFYLAATLHSAIQYWRGQGGEWKGRVQDGSGKNNHDNSI